MKTEQLTPTNDISKQHEVAMMYYLEMGNHAGESGKDQLAIDFYIKGLQIARELEQKPRVQQFSNLILTFL